MYTKEVFIEVDYLSWPSPLTPIKKLGLIDELHKFNLSEVLFHIGRITGHPEDIGLTPNSFWAYLRYYNCFLGSTKLKLSEKFMDVDPHQKTILSDDFGMGFSSYYLTEKLDLIDLTDTSYFLKYLPSLNVKKSKRSGPSKMPDFILLDNKFNIHVLECKGTQSSVNKLESQLKNGLPQKQNITDPRGIVDQRLVTGIFIPQYGSNENPVFKIMDPEFDMDFSDVSKKELVFRALQSKLSKELHFIGLNDLANKIANTSDLREVNLKTIITRLNDFKSRSYNTPFNLNISWTLDYDLSFLKEHQFNNEISLKYLFEILYQKKEEYPFMDQSFQEGNYIKFKSGFGLTVHIDH